MFTGVVSIKLSKPLKWEDGEFASIDLDFGKVTGAVIVQCERETFSAGNMGGYVKSLNTEYCTRMAACISGVPYRFLEKLQADDFDTVWQTVGAFVGKRNPQEFYDQFTAQDDEPDFPNPAK